MQEGIMGSLFRSSDNNRQQNLAQEMTQTMSSLLEDTLLKNIQLKVLSPSLPLFLLSILIHFHSQSQTDIETLGNEVDRLEDENKKLKQQRTIFQPLAPQSNNQVQSATDLPSQGQDKNTSGK
jgi:hypothetical protein